jgi:hypothetical protein
VIPIYTVNLERAQDRLALAVGPERATIARVVLRSLLEHIEAGDITHSEAADAVRTALAALEGRP